MINQINNPQIAAPALLANWIGCSETHTPPSKYNEKEIAAMEKYIKTVAYFMSFDYISRDCKTVTDEKRRK